MCWISETIIIIINGYMYMLNSINAPWYRHIFHLLLHIITLGHRIISRDSLGYWVKNKSLYSQAEGFSTTFLNYSRQCLRIWREIWSTVWECLYTRDVDIQYDNQTFIYFSTKPQVLPCHRFASSRWFHQSVTT